MHSLVLNYQTECRIRGKSSFACVLRCSRRLRSTHGCKGFCHHEDFSLERRTTWSLCLIVQYYTLALAPWKTPFAVFRSNLPPSLEMVEVHLSVHLVATTRSSSSSADKPSVRYLVGVKHIHSYTVSEIVTNLADWHHKKTAGSHACAVRELETRSCHRSGRGRFIASVLCGFLFPCPFWRNRCEIMRSSWKQLGNDHVQEQSREYSGRRTLAFFRSLRNP